MSASGTSRLYYDDAYMTGFEATVVHVQPRGAQLAVRLDRTAFYPASGGQPFDIGTLDGAPVVSVEAGEQGDVVHVVDGPMRTGVGGLVHGTIDWRRRFDHMQQHTGQHVLSAVLERAFGARTVSFHLGADSSTIDLDRELTAAQLSAGELDANRVIWDDAPVAVRYATEDEARSLPLRKESARAGTLRLIEVQGVDLSACGGTHVARTGAIGQIAVSSWERFKGGQRIEFLCGGRAMARFQRMRDASASAVRLLSVLPDEVPSAIERMQNEMKEQRRELGLAQLELARYEAVSLVESAELAGGIRLVARIVAGDAARLKALAAAIAAQPGAVALLVSEFTPALVLASRAPDALVPCNDVIGALAKQFGGRGGGRPDMAQCGGLQGAPAEILAAARALVEERRL